AKTAERWNHFFYSSPDRIGAGTIFYLADKASPNWRKKYDDALKADLSETNRRASAKIRTAVETKAEEQSPQENVRNRVLQSTAQFVGGFNAPDYLIDGLIQKRFCYAFTSPTGFGKTTVALRIAVHVARGIPLDDREVLKVRVLFLAGENPDDVRMRVLK